MEYLLRGDICYSENLKNLICKENAYLHIKDGLCQGVYESLPRSCLLWKLRIIPEI